MYLVWVRAMFALNVLGRKILLVHLQQMTFNDDLLIFRFRFT